jgi:hypothetical protein
MQDGIEPQIKSQLKTEILALQNPYRTIQDYLSGANYESYEIVGAVQAFKNGLGRISTHVLALYQLKGNRTKITWETLLENLEEALENIQRKPNQQPRAALQLALGMSEPKIEEVIAYLNKLGESLG